jgi:squalene synthase HpnC
MPIPGAPWPLVNPAVNFGNCQAQRGKVESALAAGQSDWTLERAYAHCREIAHRHYENFTVGSWFLPRDLRRHVYAIYAYCRFVDDLGDAAPGDRLAQLDAWEKELLACYGGNPGHPITIALRDTIQRFSIPRGPFLKLVEANRMDQRKGRYRDFSELLEYCRHSAEPVGHLFLYLFGYRDGHRQELADRTCTALQLTNFWQDVHRDYQMGRIYLPQDDMATFGVSEAQIAARRCDQNFRDLLRYQVARTRRLFAQGAELPARVRGAARLDIRLFTLGGLHILDAIERLDYDVLATRPTLSKPARLRIMLGTAARMAVGR